jgi:hypothetical protein
VLLHIAGGRAAGAAQHRLVLYILSWNISSQAVFYITIDDD